MLPVLTVGFSELAVTVPLMTMLPDEAMVTTPPPPMPPTTVRVALEHPPPLTPPARPGPPPPPCSIHQSFCAVVVTGEATYPVDCVVPWPTVLGPAAVVNHHW